MTKQEFIEKYGHIEVEFKNYYKYVFTFTGEDSTTGVKIVAYVGGSDDEIYRIEIEAGNKEPLSNFYAASAFLNGKEINSFNDNY